ncbi:MAG: cytochrome c1 [Hyphomicrobiaceae bacterium]
MMSNLSKTMRAVAAAAVLTVVPVVAAHASGDAPHIERHHWTFGGLGGHFDRKQLQRGFQVFKDVCSSCHGLNRVAFRNLVEKGGPEFPEEGVKALAAAWPNQVIDGPNDKGKMFERPAKLSDRILGPYRNEKEARDNQNGALPPDLSLITRARNTHHEAPWYKHVFLMLGDVLIGYQEGGADYVYALLTGYHEPPAGMQMADGMNYNMAFPGHQIAMVQPIPEGGAVKYQEGAGATASLPQNAADVTAFLAWAADPTLEQRKRMGWIVMLYLLVTTILLYFGKRRLWSKYH